MYQLRWPGHHLRMLLADVALRGLEALGHLRAGLEAILLVGLQLTWKCLLILGRTAMGGHVTVWVALLGLQRGLSAADNCPRSRLVTLR